MTSWELAMAYRVVICGAKCGWWWSSRPHWVQHLFDSLHNRMDHICFADDVQSEERKIWWRTGLLLRGTSAGRRSSLMGMFGES